MESVNVRVIVVISKDTIDIYYCCTDAVYLKSEYFSSHLCSLAFCPLEGAAVS